MADVVDVVFGFILKHRPSLSERDKRVRLKRSRVIGDVT
jgi:hypothetical protein